MLEVDKKPRLTNPLTVASKNGKQRLVIDLSRCLNELLPKKKFKLDDLRVLMEVIQRRDYMVVADLTSAYHNLRVHPDDYELYGFEVEQSDGTVKWYIYVVLPFGLGPVAWILTRMTKPLMTMASKHGIRACLLYTSDAADE